MTQLEQVQLATSKVEHWRGKVERSQGILRKWEGTLAKLTKGKPTATATKLPPLTLVPDTTREAAMAAISKAADEAKVRPLKGKAKPSSKGKPKK
jgi:hypothetical protein